MIAKYIIEYAKEHENFVPRDLLASLEASNLEDKDELINQISELYLERNHPNICNKELLDSLHKVIEQEKDRIFEKDTLDQSLEGKDPLDKARIVSEHNRRKMKKK